MHDCALVKFNLGKIHRLMKEYKIVFHYFDSAVEQNYPEALKLLGNMYYFGQGVSRDREKLYITIYQQ